MNSLPGEISLSLFAATCTVFMLLVSVLAGLLLWQKRSAKIKQNQVDKNSENDNSCHDMLNNLYDIVYIHKLSGDISYINQAVFHVLGYKAADLINKPFKTLISPKYAAEWDLYIQTVFEENEHKGLLHLQDINGQEIIFEYRNSIIHHFGVSVSVQGLARNVSDHIKTANALAESKKQYKLLFDMLPYGAVIINHGGEIVTCSKNITRLIGYRAYDLTGKNISTIIDDKSAATIQKYIDEPNTLVNISDEIQMVHRNSSRVDVLISLQKLSDEKDCFKGLLIVNIDITKHKITEMENKKLNDELIHSQKMEALGGLAGGIAHDFNNILSVIKGFTDLAIDELKGEKAIRENLQEVQIACKHGQNLIRQISIFSRKYDQEYKPVNLKEVIVEAIKLTRDLVPRSIELQESLNIENAIIRSDPVQIHQIIINLTSNAVYALHDKKEGSIDIILEDCYAGEKDIKQLPALKSGRYTKLVIKDNGKGMDQQTCARIFDPFFTTKTMGKGSGMGLAMVHGIVKSHNGCITVESMVGKGTSFSIYLPLIEEENVDCKPKQKSLEYGCGNLLFVDDEESLVKMNVKFLERLGYNVTGETSSKKALDLFASKKDEIDLIITDMIMPYMTGLELAIKVKEIKPAIPVILLSGNIDETELDSKNDPFIYRYLDKPVDPSELSKVVSKALNN